MKCLLPSDNPRIKRVHNKFQAHLLYVGKAGFFQITNHMRRPLKILAISLIWNFRVSRNCASLGGIAICLYVIPSSRTATLWLFLPENCACQLCRSLSGSFTIPVCSRIPPGVAPLEKNVAPYSSVAIAIHMAFFAIAIGLYPMRPSKPSPGICNTSSFFSTTCSNFCLLPASSKFLV